MPSKVLSAWGHRGPGPAYPFSPSSPLTTHLTPMLASTGHAGAWPTQSTCPSTGHAVTWTHTDQLAVAGSRQKAIPTGGTAGKRGSLPLVRGTQHTEAWHSPGAVSHATGTQDTPVVDTASRLLPQAPERLAGRRDPGSSMVRGALAARAAATAAVRGKSCTSPCMPPAPRMLPGA